MTESQPASPSSTRIRRSDDTTTYERVVLLPSAVHLYERVTLIRPSIGSCLSKGYPPSPQATLLDIANFVHSCHHVVGSASRPEVPEAGSSSRPEAGPSRSEAGPAAAIRGGGIPTGVIMSGSSVQVLFATIYLFLVLESQLSHKTVNLMF